MEEANTFLGLPQSLVANGSQATLKGIELEVSFRPTRRLSIDGSATFSDGKYGRLFTVATPTGAPLELPAGRRFAYIPDRTLRLSAAWQLPVPDNWGDVTLSGDFYHQTESSGLVTRPEGPLNTIPGYSVGNVRLDFRRIAGTSFDLALYVKNVTDKLFTTNVLDDSQVLGWATRNYGDPRLYGLQLTYRFGT